MTGKPRSDAFHPGQTRSVSVRRVPSRSDAFRPLWLRPLALRPLALRPRPAPPTYRRHRHVVLDANAVHLKAAARNVALRLGVSKGLATTDQGLRQLRPALVPTQQETSRCGLPPPAVRRATCRGRRSRGRRPRAGPQRTSSAGWACPTMPKKGKGGGQMLALRRRKKQARCPLRLKRARFLFCSPPRSHASSQPHTR